MGLTNTGSGDSCKCKALVGGLERQLQTLISIVIFMTVNYKQSVHENHHSGTDVTGLGSFVSVLLMHVVFPSLQNVVFLSMLPRDNRSFSVVWRLKISKQMNEKH